MPEPIDPPEIIIPYLERLRGLVECSDWHTDDPLEQTQRLVEWVWRLPGALPQPLGAVLAAPVRPGGRPTQALLALAAQLHDLGKAETYTRQPDGSTRCEGHEAASTRLAHRLLPDLNLASLERSFILALVRDHGEPYLLYKQIASSSAAQRRAALNAFAARQAGGLLPLLLLAYGDLITSHLAQNKPEKFTGLEAFYRAWLVDLIHKADSG